MILTVEEPGLIDAYLDSLARALSFDQSLARRARTEVEDHLREAVAANPTQSAAEAARQAIDRFGPPGDIAAQFASTSLLRQTRGVGATAMLAIFGAYLAMKGRLAWYALTQWAATDDPTIQSVNTVIASLDRSVFLLALIVGLLGWAHTRRARGSSVLDAACRKRLRSSFVICGVATMALIASVALDTALTSLRLSQTAWSAAFLIPVVTLGLEVALAILLAGQLRQVMQRTARAAALLHRERERTLA